MGVLEPNDGFTGFGEAETLASETLDGFGIVAQSVHGGAELFAGVLLFLNLLIEADDPLAVTFVLLDERAVPNADEEHEGSEAKKFDEASQLVPDAKVNFHRGDLTTTRSRTEAN